MFREEKAQIDAKTNREKHKEYVRQLENRNAVLQFQNLALLNETKSLKKLYERSNDG